MKTQLQLHSWNTRTAVQEVLVVDSQHYFLGMYQLLVYCTATGLSNDSKRGTMVHLFGGINNKKAKKFYTIESEIMLPVST